MSQLQPKTRYTPHRVIRDGAVFVTFADSDIVLEVKPTITKVTYLLNEKNKAAIAPDGNKIYGISWAVNVIILTKEEWQVRKQMLENGET